MLEAQHIKIKVVGEYRCIVISDIHSHLDRFKALLKKVDYRYDDYLIILGDFIEKGTQALETVRFLQELQVKIKQFLRPYFQYFKTLPTILEFNNFIFVHAGIENRKDWQNSSTSSLIEMRTFYQTGHCLDKYVVVGHLPTSNQYANAINNDIIIDKQKRIISIDGGTGVKSISQLNALIITGDGDRFKLSKEYIQPLPLYQAVVDVNVEKQVVNKVEVLKQGKLFSTCKQIKTGKIFKIKNEFLYLNNQKYYCLDDYVDYLIPLEKGEVIKLVGIYGPYAYVIKDNEIGWVKYRYLKKVN